MKSGKPFSSEEYTSLYSRVPRVTAEAVIWSKNGIVLVKRSLPDWYGMWHIPGVTILLGERLEEAVKRAAQQEVGVDIDILSCIGPYEFRHEQEVRGWGHTIGIAYECTTTDEIAATNSDGEELGVFTMPLPTQIIPEQKILLERIFTQRHSSS